MKKVLSLFFLSIVFIISFLYIAPNASNKAYAVCAGPNGVTFQTGQEYCGGDSYPGNGPTTSLGVVCAAPITSSFFTCSSSGTFTPNSCGTNACGYNSATDIGCFAACKAAPTAPVGTCNNGDRRCVGTSGSTTAYQTCVNGNWGTNETCQAAGTFCNTLPAAPFASCKFPPAPSVAPTGQPGANYTVSGKVFLDSAFSGDRNQTGMGGISVTLTYQSSGSTITKADGTYTITLPYKVGQVTEDVVVSFPKGYSISPATLDTQLTTGSKQILGSGNQIRISISPSNPNPVVDFGLVTPPSSVKVDHGAFTINTAVSTYSITGGAPQVMVDQTIQGGGVNGIPMRHALTDKTGKVSFTGIKADDFGYALTLTVPPEQTIHSVLINGKDVGAGNPIKFVFATVDMTGWNQSLITPLGTGVVKFQNIVYVDPAKTSSPVNVQWYLASSTGDPRGYWLIPYPNGGGYCMPISIGGQPISVCAQLKNSPPGGVTGTGPAPSQAPSAAPSQAPIPVCDIITDPGTCQGAVANTCNANNGTKAVKYGSSSTGQQCEEKIVSTVCTHPNCSAGYSCQSGTCVNTQPSIAPTAAVTGTSPTALPTITTAPSLSPIPSSTETPAPVPGDTVFNLILGLDGLGTTGDNAAPNNSSGSNKNPLHKTRNVTVELYNSSNSLVLTKPGSVIYNTGTGKFPGTVNMGNAIPSGSYTIKIKSDGYLKKLVPGVQVLTTTNEVNNINLPAINLVTGDITQDNAINIIDYNISASCSIYSSDSNQLCNTNSSYGLLSDLDDNGTVNEFDYNLFIKEYSVQNGQ